MRALKRRLTALGETCAESPIASRLIELARSDDGPSAASVRDPAFRSPADLRPRTVRILRQSGAGWKVATGSAGSALIAIAFAAFLLGNVSTGPPAPKVTPSVDSYLVQHSYDVSGEPGVTVGNAGGSAGGRHSWSHGADAYVRPPVSPSRIGLAQLGQPAESTRSGRPAQSASASSSPRPLASASASPAPSGPAQSGGSPRTHPASLRYK